MKNISIAFVLMVAMFSTGFAQKTKIFKYPFVNQTEFGLLPGRVKEMNYYYPYYYRPYYTYPSYNYYYVNPYYY